MVALKSVSAAVRVDAGVGCIERETRQRVCTGAVVGRSDGLDKGGEASAKRVLGKIACRGGCFAPTLRLLRGAMRLELHSRGDFGANT